LHAAKSKLFKLMLFQNGDIAMKKQKSVKLDHVVRLEKEKQQSKCNVAHQSLLLTLWDIRSKYLTQFARRQNSTKLNFQLEHQGSKEHTHSRITISNAPTPKPSLTPQQLLLPQHSTCIDHGEMLDKLKF